MKHGLNAERRVRLADFTNFDSLIRVSSVAKLYTERKPLMKRLLFALAVVAFGVSAGIAGDSAWVSIFNGKDLTGWEGDPKLWSVKDGALTGSTVGNPLKYNKFLLWTGKVDNFELKCKFRMEGGNSGIQYRSQHLKDKGDWVVGGYQADMDAKGGFTGILYEERGRQILATVGQKVVID